MTTMKITPVGTLPANAVTRYNHAKIAEALRADPGQWYKITKGKARLMHALAAKWRTQRPNGFGSGSFDFRAVATKKRNNTATLFGRYLGPDPDAEVVPDAATLRDLEAGLYENP